MPIYLGTFVIAFASLALQITITRLLSISTWYHVAFFAIGTAMLGMTIGAVRIYCAPQRFTENNLNRNLMRGCMGFAISTPLTLLALCVIPLSPSIFSPLAMVCLAAITAACLLPYYFAGIVITLVLTRCSLPVGRVYAADLLGASLGCLFVLAAMDTLDVASLMLVCAGIGALAACAYAWSADRRAAARCLAVGLCLLVGGTINSQSRSLIRPLVTKGRYRPPGEFAFEKYNSFSHILGKPIATTTNPQLWGRSPRTPQSETEQFLMVIDGGAGTFARRFKSLADIEHLRFDVTNAAYHLRRDGGACVIGVGGGRDLQSALLFGHNNILGIDINPIFIHLVQNEFREFLGLADKPQVRMVIDDARSYLSQSDESFAVLQMSLIDTWAATGAGAYTLSENSLYTVEAWNIFLRRLAPNGIFTVSRWYNPENLGETGRLLSLAMASLLNQGIKRPQDHLALIASGPVATLLACARPFTAEEIESLQDYCQKYEFQPVILPGVKIEHPAIRQIIQAERLEDLVALTADQAMRLDPPTDESPYFFNVLGLRSLLHGYSLKPGVFYGNVIASQTLAALIGVLALASLCTVIVPLWLRPKSIAGNEEPAPLLWSGAAYFSLIGAGFMLVEIALVQRLSVLLSHPTYALGILLFTLILSAGVGSLASERLPLTRTPWVYIYPLLPAILILVTSEAVRYVLAHVMTADLATKIFAAVAVIFPLGVSLGLCFPTGMRLVHAARSGETPWYWALNGVFGVLCSAIAVGISIFATISLNFYIAAACYALVTFAAARIYSHVNRQRYQHEPPFAVAQQ